MNKRSGFTLMELLVAVAVIGLLAVVLSAIVVASQRSAAIERTRIDLTTENRLLLDETMRAVKNARGVLPEATILGDDYVTGSDTLILELPTIDSNQTIIPSTFDRLVFYRDGSSYLFSQEGGTGSVRPDIDGRVLSGRTGSVTFSFYDSTGGELVTNYQTAYAVMAAVSLSATVRGQTITSTLSDTTTLRNK